MKTQYIDKSAIVAEIKRLISIANSQYDLVGDEDIRNRILWSQQASVCSQILSFIDTLEVKDVNSVWHNIDDIPNFNLGVSDLIIDSYYGHIYGEAHFYTPEQWSAHIGFNTNRQFRWAYEKDLIEV